jgi:tetratricopeptide (TPR) repeat protein
MMNFIHVSTLEGKIAIELARVYFLTNLFRSAEVEQILPDVFELLEQLEVSNPDIHQKYVALAKLMNAYFFLYTRRGESLESAYKETIELYREIWQTTQTRGEFLDFDIMSFYMMALYNYGYWLSVYHRLTESQEFLEEALARHDHYLRSVQDFSQDTKTRMVWGINYALSLVYTRTGKLDESIKLCRSGLDVITEPIGRERMFFISSGALALSLRLEEAEQALRRSISICRELYETDPESSYATLVDALHGLSNILQQMNRFTEAEVLLKEGAKICQTHSKEETLNYEAYQHNELAILNQKLCRLEEARNFYQESLRIIERGLKQTSTPFARNQATVRNNYAMLLRQEQKYDESEHLYHQSLHTWREFAESHPEGWQTPYSVSKILNNLGVLMRHQQQLRDAEKFFEEAIELRKSAVEKSPEFLRYLLAVPMNNLGVVLAENARYDESGKLLEEAQKINSEYRMKSADVLDPRIAMNLNNLGILNVKLEKPKEAEKLFRSSKAIYERLSKKAPEVYQSKLTTLLSNILILTSNKDILAQLEDLGIKEPPVEYTWLEEEEDFHII